MRQFNKDPDRLADRPQPTPSSPKTDLSSALLVRYLDYCSEQLAVLGKLAALCVQEFDDPVTLAAVDQLDDLTSDLSRKVWQKIIVVDRFLADAPPTP